MWEHGGCSIRCPHGTCVSILDSHSIGHVNVAECIGTIIVTVAANWKVWSQVPAVPFVGGPEYMCLCGGSLKRGKHFAQADSLNFGCESDVFVSSSLIDNV